MVRVVLVCVHVVIKARMVPGVGSWVFIRRFRRFGLSSPQPDGRETPKDMFPDSPLTSTSEWPEERDRCVFDYNKVRCPYGEKCTRSHINTSKSSPSVAATNGSNSPKIRALDVMMRKLSAQKDQLLAAEEAGGSISSVESDHSFDPHKMPPLPPTMISCPG